MDPKVRVADKPLRMQERASAEEGLLLLEILRSPHLSTRQFPNAHRLQNLNRYNQQTVSIETVREIRSKLKEVEALVDKALADPTPQTFAELTALPQVKATSFGDQALTRRLQRGRPRDGDLQSFAASLAGLKAALNR